MRTNRTRRLPAAAAAAIALIAAALACGPRPEVTPTVPTEVAQATTAAPQDTPAPTTEAAVTPTVEPTLAPGVTPSATQITPTVCTLDAVYVTDVTVTDGTDFAPGAAFTKTWRVNNNGCLNWPSGTKLVYTRGDHMGGPASVTAPAAAVGTNVEISVNLTAPATVGTYKGYWQLEAPDGTRFGDEIWVSIDVVVAATVTPTITLTPTVTPEPETLILNMAGGGLTGDVSTGGCGSQMRAGIAPAGNAIRGLTSFDITALHGKTIIAATLDAGDYTLTGNPFALEPLFIEQVAFEDVCGDYPDTFNSGNEIVRLARVTEAAGLDAPIDVKAALVAALGAATPPDYFQIRARWKGDDSGAAFASMIKWSPLRLIVVYLP
jgi:hypothetical protein